MDAELFRKFMRYLIPMLALIGLLLLFGCAYYSRPIEIGRTPGGLPVYGRERVLAWSVTRMGRISDDTGAIDETGIAANGLFDYKKGMMLVNKDSTAEATMGMDLQDMSGGEKSQVIAVPVAAIVKIIAAFAQGAVLAQPPMMRARECEPTAYIYTPASVTPILPPVER